MSNSPERESFITVLGKNMRSFRKYLGLNMVDAAKGMQLSQPFLSQIENGKKDISVKTLSKIFNFFILKSGLSHNAVVYLLLNEDFNQTFEYKIQNIDEIVSERMKNRKQK